jgi:hypothetical protein
MPTLEAPPDFGLGTVILRIQNRNEVRIVFPDLNADLICCIDVPISNPFPFLTEYRRQSGGCNQIADQRKAGQHSNLHLA